MAEPLIPAAEAAATSANARRPVRAATGALTTTIAVSIPVFLVGGLAVQIGDELGFSPAGLGLAVSAYFGASALASVPAGALVERYGSATISRCAIGLASASLLAVAVGARSLWSLVAILALGAAANALGQLASNAALARHVPARRQGVSVGVKQAAIPISTLLAGVAVPTIALTAGWRWAFVVAAVPTLVALPLWLMTPKRERGAAPPRTAEGRPALRPPRLGLILAGIFGFQSMCFASMVSWVAALYLDAGWSAQAAAAATAAIPLATIPAALVIPALSDGRDRRPWLFGSGIVMTVGMMGLAFAPLVAPWLWLTAASVGAGALFPLSLTLPIDLRDDAVAVTQLTAWMLGLGYFLSALGPVIVGALRDLTGGFTVAIAVVGTLGALSGLLGLSPDLRRSRRAPQRADGLPEAPVA